MVIYCLRRHPDYQGIVPCRDEDWDLLSAIRGQRVPRWEPLRVEVLPDDQYLLRGDFPFLATHLPILSEQARVALDKLLKAHGEFLELRSYGEQYWAFNVSDVRDALDEKRSVVKRFKDGGIMHVVNYSFIGHEVRDAVIFRLLGLEEMDVFVTDHFISASNEAGLAGLRAEPVSNV